MTRTRSSCRAPIYRYQGGYPEITINAIQQDREYYRKHIGNDVTVWDTEGGKCIANRLTNRPLSAEDIQRKLKDNPRALGYWWMHPAVSEWQQACEVSRDYLVKWGEGIEKIFSGNYGDYCHGPNVCSWRDGVPVVACLTSIHQIQLLHDAEFIGKLATPENIYAYLFKRERRRGIFKSPGYILACWTTVGKGQIRLQTGASRITRLDLFGNPRAIATAGGETEIELSEWPVYLQGIKADARLLPPKFTVDFDSSVISAGSACKLTITVTNAAAANAIQGTIQFELPRGWEDAPSQIVVTCPPGADRQIDSELRVPPSTPDGVYDLLVKLLDAETGAESRRKLAFTVKNTIVCPYMTKTPAIDGDLSGLQGFVTSRANTAGTPFAAGTVLRAVTPPSVFASTTRRPPVGSAGHRDQHPVRIPLGVTGGTDSLPICAAGRR